MILAVTSRNFLINPFTALTANIHALNIYLNGKTKALLET